MGWVSWPVCNFVCLASFSALWWPNIWLKMRFPELFEKTIGSIHFISGIYPYGVSLSTPVHLPVPNLIFGLLVAKYLADCKIEIFIGYFWMRWVLIRAGVYCPHLWAQLVLNRTIIYQDLIVWKYAWHFRDYSRLCKCSCVNLWYPSDAICYHISWSFMVQAASSGLTNTMQSLETLSCLSFLVRSSVIYQNDIHTDIGSVMVMR